VPNTERQRAYGFVFVTDTPYSDSEATKKLLERIAFIRVTHYGGFYDFIPDLSMADTAYTNVALPAHTDTTYFTEPAGLQAFHLLSHDPPPAPDWTRKGTPSLSSAGLGAAIRPSRIRPLSMPALGGESLLIDGFRAAKILMEEDPTAYKILRTVGLPWHASGNKGITIAPDQRYPVLEHRKDSGELFRIRWNNDDRGVVPFDLGIDPMHWYDAARAWQRILRQEDSRYLTKLTPGTTLSTSSQRPTGCLVYTLICPRLSLRQLARLAWPNRVPRTQKDLWGVQYVGLGLCPSFIRRLLCLDRRGGQLRDLTKRTPCFYQLSC